MTKPKLVVRTAEGLEGGNLAWLFLRRAVETLSQPEKRRGLMGGKKREGRAGNLVWYQTAGRHLLKADPLALLKYIFFFFFFGSMGAVCPFNSSCSIFYFCNPKLYVV